MKYAHRNVENIERRWITVDGLRLYTLAAENSAFKEKSPIILVQGLAIAARYWIPAIAELSENFNVYAVDLPGFGQSDKPFHILNISELSDALAAWMQNIGINHAVLVGHSFGCQITADFALRYPGKIDRAVLAAPTVDKRGRTFWQLIWRSLRNAPQEPVSLIWIAVKSFFQFGLIREIRTLQFALGDKIEDKLPRFEIPTLVLRGSKDTVVPDDWAQEITRLLPRGALVTVTNGTHGFNYSSPQKFAVAIREFLNSEKSFYNQI